MDLNEVRTENSKVITLAKNVSRVYSKYGIYLILLFLIVVISFLTDNFFTYSNLITVVRQICFISLIGLGVMVVIITKGIDLSSGSIVGVTSVVIATAATTWQQPFIVVIFIGLAIGGLSGAINGTLVATTGMPPFIVTLGMFTTARGLAYLFCDGRPISVIERTDITFLGGGDVLGIPMPILFLAIVAVITHVMLSKTKLGKSIYAVGANENAAKISGISVTKVKLFVYIFAGILSAFSGTLVAARVCSGIPDLGIGYEFDAITAAVIGGTSFSGGVGTVAGTIAGALVVGVINNGMDLMAVNLYWQLIVKGTIIILAVWLDSQKNRYNR